MQLTNSTIKYCDGRGKVIKMPSSSSNLQKLGYVWRMKDGRYTSTNDVCPRDVHAKDGQTGQNRSRGQMAGKQMAGKQYALHPLLYPT